MAYRILVDPSSRGYCEGCQNPVAFLRICPRGGCEELRCEMCLPGHLAEHDPGGLGSIPKPKPPKPREDHPMSDGTSTWKRMNGYAPGYSLLVGAVLFCGWQWYQQGQAVTAQGLQLEGLRAQVGTLVSSVEALRKEVGDLHDRVPVPVRAR